MVKGYFVRVIVKGRGLKIIVVWFISIFNVKGFYRLG